MYIHKYNVSMNMSHILNIIYLKYKTREEIIRFIVIFRGVATSESIAQGAQNSWVASSTINYISLLLNYK